MCIVNVYYKTLVNLFNASAFGSVALKPVILLRGLGKHIPLAANTTYNIFKSSQIPIVFRQIYLCLFLNSLLEQSFSCRL